MKINKIAVEDTLPNLVIYINLDIQTALSRIGDKDNDKFETYDENFYKRAIRGYKEASELSFLKKVWVNISGSGTEDEVFERVKAAIDRKLKL